VNGQSEHPIRESTPYDSPSLFTCQTENTVSQSGVMKTAKASSFDSGKRKSESVPPPEPEAKPRLSFALNPDGTVDFESMRSSTREKLRQVYSDPATAKALGLVPESTPTVNIFNPAMVAGMYGLLGTIETAILPKFFPKVPEHLFRQVFTYTPQEVELLTPPTARVLNKYCSAWFLKWQDEIALATLLSTMTLQKVTLLNALARAEAESKVVTMPSPPAPAEPEPGAKVQ